MRKIYSLAAAALFAVSVNAQNTVFFDDFESNSLEGYTLYNLDGLVPDDTDLASMTDSAWTVRFISSAGWQHGLSAFSVSWYVNDTGPSDDWLVTPAITIAGEAVLSWDALAITSSGNFRDRYQVYISPSPDLEVIAENAEMIFDTGAIGELATPNSRSIDLAALGYADETIYICFRNWTQPFGSNPGGPGNGGNELAIDNIRVTDNSVSSTSQSDLFRNAVVQPNPSAGSSAEVLFTIERAEQVFIELIDLTGKVIKVENRGILSPGNHMLTIQRNGLASGIYLVRLRTADQAQVMRIAFQ